MTVTINVFASLREQLGKSSWEESIPDDADTGALLDLLSRRHEEIAGMRRVIRVAVNDQWTSSPVKLNENDHVALLTPVSGG